MPIPFIMPKMDMDQETVTINEWLKKEGDQVKKGEPVIVIETDKITSEVEAPATGTLAGVLYGDNVDVPVTKIIAYILEKGETEADLPEIQEKNGEKTKPSEENVVKQVESTLTAEKDERQATPIAKKMAAANGIDLATVPSSSDKITKEDIEAFLAGQEEFDSRVQTPATPAARRIAREKGIDLTELTGSGPRGRVQAEDVEKAAGQPAISPMPVSGDLVPLQGMRKRIAERLTESYQTTPHIFLNVEVDMTEAENSRKRLNKLVEQEGSAKISMTAYLTRIVAWALQQHPMLNASLQGDSIKLWDEIHIGIATALDEGLIVPVIHNADHQSVKALNECLRYLTKKARKGELSREEIQGGTFTISNLGMFGIDAFTAIINPPQSAILAVGAVKRKPVVIDDQDTIAVRPMMQLTLAADHRVVDGAVAAAFLSDVVRALETPELLLF